MKTPTPLLLSALLSLGACSGGDKATDSSADTAGADGTDGTEEPQPVTSTLAVSFEIDPDYRDNMDEPATGPFWGNVYDADDVSSVGPDDGAESLASVYVEAVDVTGAATGVLVETEPVTAVKVIILGFLDSDGNADPDSPGPDNKDPVTLPGDNRFTLEDGSTDVTVYFGLLNP